MMMQRSGLTLIIADLYFGDCDLDIAVRNFWPFPLKLEINRFNLLNVKYHDGSNRVRLSICKEEGSLVFYTSDGEFICHCCKKAVAFLYFQLVVCRTLGRWT